MTEAEGLTLRVAENKTGYFGVYHQPGKPKRYKAEVRHGGKIVSLGTFATAEEAALSIARSPEGQEAAQRAAAAKPLTSEEARQQAQVERLTLLVAENMAGYFGVHLKPGKPKPYHAQVKRGGKDAYLGRFATAEEAALCVARSPEGQAAAQRAAAVLPLTSKEARQQARAERLTLLKAKTKTGYFGVKLDRPGRSKPYRAQVWAGGKQVSLGTFATGEEAALCVARSPEGKEEAKKAAAPPPLTSEEALQQVQAEGLTLRVADNKAGYYGVHLSNPGRPKPYEAQVRRGGKKVSLGSFATAEEAALCIARSPEGQAAPPRSAAELQLTSEDALQQAQAEGLMLRVANSTTGYACVNHKPGRSKPYEVQVRRGGKKVSLGSFTTAEEAALCVARCPEEGLAHGLAASRSAAAPQLTSEDALQQARDAIVREAALDIIHEAAGAALAELSAEVAAEVMAGIAMGL